MRRGHGGGQDEVAFCLKRASRGDGRPTMSSVSGAHDETHPHGYCRIYLCISLLLWAVVFASPASFRWALFSLPSRYYGVHPARRDYAPRGAETPKKYRYGFCRDQKRAHMPYTRAPSNRVAHSVLLLHHNMRTTLTRSGSKN